MHAQDLKAKGKKSQQLCGMLVFLGLLLGRSVTYAQFSSGSNGSDGALDFSGQLPGTVIVFDPRTMNPPRDGDNDNVYHFTTITIPTGVTVRLRGSQLNMRPVFWLASGAVQISGTLDLSGADGHPVTSNPAERTPSMPGPGGFGGGVGSPPQPGLGPGGGGIAIGGNATGGSGGFAQKGGDGGFGGGSQPGPGGPAYGNAFLVPLIGGSGGAGTAAGGGAGGGALLIASSVSITINGSILTNGGASTGTSSGFPGGGGSGGAIHCKAPTISGAGILRALGGSPSTHGGPGSPGRIRLEAVQHQFTGSSNPSASLAAPSPVFLPQTPPSIRVVAVNGVPVPPNPTGGFNPSDISLNAGATVSVTIEARHVPVNTVTQVYLFSENGPDQILNAPPLVQQSNGLLTATLNNVVIPLGFSRAFVRAKWTP